MFGKIVSGFLPSAALQPSRFLYAAVAAATPSTTRTTPTALATDEAAAALARRSSTSLPAGGKGDSEHAKSCASSSFERGGPTPCRAVGAPGAYPSSGDCRL